jgi:hypothetical protein
MDYKILSIDRRYYPSAHGTVSVLTVLVAGDIGDYAAYSGISDEPQWVARLGDKLSFKEACCHFSGLEESKYRP